MEKVIEQLTIMNHKDWVDILCALMPVVLTIVLIVQNHIIQDRNAKLQKQIHNRDVINQAHEDILRVYRTYYDFCNTIYASQFFERVRHGDVNYANAFINNLYILRQQIGQNRDLTNLLFMKSDSETYEVINAAFEHEVKIVDAFIQYINSNRLYEVSENAWNEVLNSAKNSMYANIVRYNYQELMKNSVMYNNFLTLCKSPELDEISRMLEKDRELHSYENYDAYFEKYLRIDKM